jgi:hypothetical protein
MKKPSISVWVTIIVMFFTFSPVALGKDKKAKKPYENPDAILTVILYMERGKQCMIESSSELMELYIDKQTNEVKSWPYPTLIDFNYNCGDCKASGTVTVWLQNAKIITRDNQRYLRFKIEVDNDAIMKCHPLNPLNNQKYQAYPHEASYEFPFKDGYRTNFSPSAVWMHFVLDVKTK